MIKLACMTWPYARFSFERALQGIAEAGFRYVSIGLPHEGRPIFNDAIPGEAGEAARLLKLLDRYGLKPVTLISTDALTTKQPLEAAKRRMDLAVELGITELLSLGTSSYRRFPDEPLNSDEMAVLNTAFAAKFQLVGAEAEKRGLTVSLKPHTGNTAAAKQLTETLQLIDSPAIKASYDPGNVHYYEGIDTVQDLPLISNQLVSFVAKDHQGERAEVNFPIPGDGDIDFPSLFSILSEADFTGPVIVERLDGRGESFTLEELDQRVAAARRNLEAMLKEAGFLCE